MTCTASTPVDELQFVVSLHSRSRDVGECRGPLLRIDMSAWRVFSLERIFDSQVATDVLWAGHLSFEKDSTAFSLCAVHWLDLAALVWMRSRQQQRADWHAEADQLLHDACTAAGWDPKEIVNMFQWQATRLT